MFYPVLKENRTERSVIEEFRGYNHNLRIGEGEFYDTLNLTTDNYPVLATRNHRGKILTANNPNGIISKDAIAYIDGGKLYYNYNVISDLELTNSEKTLISMGGLLLIFPDNKYVDTVKDVEHDSIDIRYGSLGHKYVSAVGDKVKFSICKADGESLGSVGASDIPPDKPGNGQLWIDTSDVPHTLKKWSEQSSMWIAFPTVYVKIEATGIGIGFEKYDGVKISGCKAHGTTDFNNTSVIWEKDDGYIVIIGFLDADVVQTDGSIEVERVIPDFDFVTESENRLWGCKYGMVDGKVVNEIYASKLGDPKNFNCFMGLSTDSFASTVGSDGFFTGAVTHLGHPLFFKENCIHKVFGNYPANFQIQTTNVRGVQKGSEKSLCIVNETLFYKSVTDVCAYDGSLPVGVSDALGGEFYKNAVSGSIGNKYYISMQNSNGIWNLFVFDTQKGIWMREDNTRAKYFSRCDNELYIFNEKKELLTLLGSKGTREEPFHWHAESGNIGYSYPDKKYISRFTIRMILPEGSKASFYIQYDSSGEWTWQCDIDGTGASSFTVQAIPRRCDHLRIKIEGKGDCKIISITKSLEVGSDL